LQVTGREWRFGFEARSFLTRQVRLMVGGVMSVATGSLDLEPFRRMIELGQRSAPLVAAPARGLLLTEVSYPDLRWPEQGGQL
jgi:tRNA pseudouridine38-40 synthase